ncbi:hypothetical protein R1flu_026900 [Riccia fluitans]|uniref:Uncharacterized protein n=1 Tax=Riccia fluitans TaxID=41844 RepID=A0ABD1XH99_9MARC
MIAFVSAAQPQSSGWPLHHVAVEYYAVMELLLLLADLRYVLLSRGGYLHPYAEDDARHNLSHVYIASCLCSHIFDIYRKVIGAEIPVNLHQVTKVSEKGSAHLEVQLTIRTVIRKLTGEEVCQSVQGVNEALDSILEMVVGTCGCFACWIFLSRPVFRMRSRRGDQRSVCLDSFEKVPKARGDARKARSEGGKDGVDDDGEDSERAKLRVGLNSAII